MERISATVRTIGASHVLFMTRPADIAEIIALVR